MADAAPSEEAPSFTSTLLDDLLPSLLLELDLRALCRMGGVCKLLQKTVDKMLKRAIAPGDPIPLPPDDVPIPLPPELASERRPLFVTALPDGGIAVSDSPDDPKAMGVLLHQDGEWRTEAIAWPTGLAVDAPEFAPDAPAPLVSPDAPSPRASSPEDAPEDPEFAAELARAQANVDRMEALKQGRKVSVVDPSHYKTRMCVYLGGRGCPHGANCAFAHSSMELRPPAASTMAEYKTRPCRYSLAECPFAAAGRCQFAHSLDELRPGPATHRQKVEHRYKTKMCKYFLAGHCPYVATGTCQFAHSRDELMAGRGSIHRAEYMNVGPAGTLPRAAFNWRDPTVLAAVGQLGGSFDDVGESAQAWPAPARFGEEAPTE